MTADRDGATVPVLEVFSTRDGGSLARETQSGKGTDAELLAALSARVEPRVSKLELGGDPGTELYKSGSATKTAFEVWRREHGK